MQMTVPSQFRWFRELSSAVSFLLAAMWEPLWMCCRCSSLWPRYPDVRLFRAGCGGHDWFISSCPPHLYCHPIKEGYGYPALPFRESGMELS